MSRTEPNRTENLGSVRLNPVSVRKDEVSHATSLFSKAKNPKKAKKIRDLVDKAKNLKKNGSSLEILEREARRQTFLTGAI